MGRVGIIVLSLALLGQIQCRAESSEDAYVRIFSGIQEADRRAASGDADSARAAYRRVLDELTTFQRAHPTWNPEVVAFRLRYLQGRLAGYKSGEGPDTVPAVPGEAGGVARPDTGVTAVLTARVHELELEVETLSAKLREALAARPAAVDPAELRRAEQRMREQQKEIDLLRAQLSQERGPSTALALADDIEKLRVALKSAQAARTAETDRAARLQDENAELARRLAELERQVRAQQDAKRSRTPAAVSTGPESPSAAQSGGLGVSPEVAAAEAIQLLDRGDAAGAERVLSVVSQEARTNVVFGCTWGRVLLTRGRGTEAVEALGRLAQENPQQAEAHHWLGRALMAQGLNAAAEDVLRRAVALDARCAGAQLALADVYRQQRPADLALARWHYGEAIQAGARRDPALERELGLVK